MVPVPNERPLARSLLGFGLRDNIIEVYGDATAAATLAARSFALNVALLLFIAVIAVAGATLTIRGARAQVRLASMQSDFISNVTHELRTPLSSIRLFARLIRTGTAETHGGGHLRAAYRSRERATVENGRACTRRITAGKPCAAGIHHVRSPVVHRGRRGQSIRPCSAHDRWSCSAGCPTCRYFSPGARST